MSLPLSCWAPLPSPVLRVVEDHDHFFLRGDGLPPGTHRFRQMHVAPELLREMTAWLDERF
jgi:hypothetical protein